MVFEAQKSEPMRLFLRSSSFAFLKSKDYGEE
jgi:hypothetical protein